MLRFRCDRSATYYQHKKSCSELSWLKKCFITGSKGNKDKTFGFISHGWDWASKLGRWLAEASVHHIHAHQSDALAASSVSSWGASHDRAALCNLPRWRLKWSGTVSSSEKRRFFVLLLCENSIQFWWKCRCSSSRSLIPVVASSSCLLFSSLSLSHTSCLLIP